jgi:hypothetical protein
MQDSPEDKPPPLPQISLRGLLLANSLIGIFVSFLTTLGIGEVSLGLLVIWGVLGIMFLVQWAILWLVVQFFHEPTDPQPEWNDPRNAFPPLPREGRGDRR